MSLENHSRCIIHIDIDCFYAQVEMIKNPSLADKPLGIQQKNIIVTSNYIARKFGVNKCMFISDAQKLCPSLVLVKGEDLKDYRQFSYKLTSLLQKYTNIVERLGLDENFLDVTELVDSQMKTMQEIKTNGFVALTECDNKCICGCYERLQVASNIAQDIRNVIREELKLTTCAGISHNKLLAKLATGINKPNQQTVLFPHAAMEFVSNLASLQNITGIGKTTSEQLESIGITSIKDLQEASIDKLTKLLTNKDKAQYIKNLSYGIDETDVKISGKPQSIGLEDSCTPLTLQASVEEKLRELLKRLMLLVNEDGRIPSSIKLTVRQDDRISQKETKQCNIHNNLFTIRNSAILLSDTAEERLMRIIINLFSKLVDIKHSFHVTLLGLSFTKFKELATGKNSIESFLKPNFQVETLNDNLSSEMQEGLNLESVSSEQEEPAPKKLKLITHCHCPPNIDESVFRQMPIDIQQELWDNYLLDNRQANCKPKSKVNTLHNYFYKK